MNPAAPVTSTLGIDSLPNDSCRHAGNYGIVCYVFRHNRTSGHNRAGTNTHSAENDCASSNPGSVTYFCGRMSYSLLLNLDRAVDVVLLRQQDHRWPHEYIASDLYPA